MTTPVREIVFRELSAAVDNGYRVDLWTARYAADNLARYSPALDDRDPDELVPHVREWLRQRRAG